MKHKKSGEVYAIKSMNKQRLKASGMISQIKTEIKIMYSLAHENIIKLYNHFEDDTNVYLVIEYASGVIFPTLFLTTRDNSGKSSSDPKAKESLRSKSLP